MRSDPAWAALDVAGQVEALIRGEPMDFVRIPASYIPGVTVIYRSGSRAAEVVTSQPSPFGAEAPSPEGQVCTKPRFSRFSVWISIDLSAV